MKELIVIFTVFTTTNLFGQRSDSIFEANPKNAIYLELGGNNLLYGINYERGLSRLGKQTFATSFGYGLSSSKIGAFNEIVIPVEVKLINGIGKKNHLEYGLGATYFYDTDRPDNVVNGVNVPQCKHRVVNFVRIGYRYTSNQGFLFRIGVTPLISRKDEPVVNLWGGVSFGYTFKRNKYENK